MPELCRFIQPADVSSLNPQSINGLNLYSYANNNPIGIAYSSFGVGGSTSGGMVSFISLSGISNGSQLGGFNSSSGSGFLGGLISGASSICSLLDGINSYLGGTIDALINYIKIPKFNSLHKKLSSCSKWLRRVGIGLELVTSAYNNYKNDDLTYNQKWASFGADVCYIAAKSGLSYLAGELVTKGSIAIGSSFAFTLVGASIGGITITFSGAIIIGACVVGVGIVAGTVLIAILTNAADNWWESKKEEWFN